MIISLTFLTIDNKERLNDIDINIIKKEYSKRTNGIHGLSYSKIDQIVMHLRFFSCLEKFVRFRLLESAHFISYDAGETIFRQGDTGELMYIILKGAVNVKITRPTVYGTTEEVTVGALYDGNSFGEYSMLEAKSQKNKKDSPLSKSSRIGTENLESPRDNKIDRVRNRSASKRELASEIYTEIEEAEQINMMDEEHQEKHRRSVTIEVTESCDLLCISRREYEFIFVNLVQRDLDYKIKILKQLPFLTVI